MLEIKPARHQLLAAFHHLVKRAWKTVEVGRLLRFCTVGLSGAVVHLGVLWLLTEVCRLYYLHSAVVATTCAIANTFLWHEVWTFADRIRTRRTLAQRLKRFLRFNVIGASGALLYLGVLWLLTDVLGIYYLMSAVVGVGTTAVWNYSLNATITW